MREVLIRRLLVFPYETYGTRVPLLCVYPGDVFDTVWNDSQFDS